MSKEKDVEWEIICDEYVNAQADAAEAFAALEEFDAGAPAEGGYEAYEKWRDKNDDARSKLEQVTLDAARRYLVAHLTEQAYLENFNG